MKFNIKYILPFALPLCFCLLVCIILSLLYTLDWISTASFRLFCLIGSCLLYMMAGWVLFHTMKKRQFIIALCLSAALLLLKVLFKDSLNDLILYGLRLILFLLTVLFLQLRNNQ